jgi:hypothetical protein
MTCKVVKGNREKAQKHGNILCPVVLGTTEPKRTGCRIKIPFEQGLRILRTVARNPLTPNYARIFP